MPDATKSDSVSSSVAQLTARLAVTQSKAKTEKTARWFVLAITVTVTAVAVFGTAQAWTLWGLVPLWIGTVFAFFLLLGVHVSAGKIEEERDKLDRELTMLQSTQGQDYFERLVSINVMNLGEYYSLVKTQTQSSFLVTVAVGVFGFLLVAAGLVVAFLGEDRQQTIAYISAGSGVVTEFIGAVFFYLYSRTVRQLKEYHDSLLVVQNILLAFKLVAEVDREERTPLIEAMLRFLMDRREKLPQNPAREILRNAKDELYPQDGEAPAKAGKQI